MNKASQIVKITEEKLGNISPKEIKDILKSIPSVHDEGLEKAVQLRDTKEIGKIILMSIYQVTQKNVEETHDYERHN